MADQPDRVGWEALRRGPPAGYGRYRAYAEALQDLPTRNQLFLNAAWQVLIRQYF